MNLTFDSSTGTMHFYDDSFSMFVIQDAIFSFEYQKDGKKIKENSAELDFTLQEEEEIIDPVFGKAKKRKYIATSALTAVQYQVEFLLPENESVALWRLEILNQLNKPIIFKQFQLLGIKEDAAHGLVFGGQQKDLRFFSQGWQSWSHTASYGIEDRMVTSNLSIAQKPLCYDAGTPRSRKKGFFSSDFFCVLSDPFHSTGMVLGYLSQLQQFGAITLDMHDLNSLKMVANGDDVQIATGKRLGTDWAIMQFVAMNGDPLDAYTTWVQRYHGVDGVPETYAGWCSWYYFYQNISETIIRDNLEIIDNLQESLPLKLIQIDDGYQKQVGDWLKFAPLFPDGVAPLAESIRKKGFLPGLWMAPFIVHPKSDLIKEHPEWILRNKHGKPVNAGFIWNVFTTSLDLTHPDALDYAVGVVREAALKWHFPYLKLDFLYAAALPGNRYDKSQTRAQILRKGFEKIRQAVGNEIYLLGCGAPMGTSIGIFDAMRIGADVSGSWMPKYFGVEWPFRGEPNMPSARNAIQNVLTRQYMHRKWWINDPDCLLVRPDSELTLTEVQTLTSVIGLSGGAFLVSDDMPALPPERMALIQKVLPIHQFQVQVLDLFEHLVPEKVFVPCKSAVETWSVIARYHWEDNPKKILFQLEEYGFAAGEYWVRSFWDNEISIVKHDQDIPFSAEPHSCKVMAVRPYQAGQATFLGSNLHIVQGIELQQQHFDQNTLSWEFVLQQKIDGFVDIYIPGKVHSILVNFVNVDWERIQENVLRVPLSGHGRMLVEVTQ